jgi:diguanylate cyclase (GGDEF)-like protein
MSPNLQPPPLPAPLASEPGDADTDACGRRRPGLRHHLPLRLVAAVAIPMLVAHALLGIALWRHPDRVANASVLAAGAAWLALAVSCGALWSLGRRLRRRMLDIDDVLHRALGGDSSHRTACGSDDELGALARRVDRLLSEAAARERRITESALCDPLTGLPNRALLAERLRHALAMAQRTRTPFAVAVLDLDRFKNVNDSFGHGAGDAMLGEVARRLKATVRESDTVARLGGDEFVILLSGGEEAAREVAGRILQSMEPPLAHRDRTIAMGLSIGVALYPDHGTDEVSLLRNADTAMYRAKRRRAGIDVYDGASNDARRIHLSILAELRDALEDGQFVLDWQPRLDVGSGCIAGVEGLLRWNHPTRGRVAPGEFLPLAEQTGIMREISLWVVREGARFAGELAANDLDLCVSVNVSLRDVGHDGFVAAVAQALQRHGIPASRLSLEFPEGELADIGDAARSGLHQLAGLGLPLAIDDFGTAGTGVAQLQALPVHALKVDRSFVCGMNQHRGNRAVVRSAVDLGRRLGLRVTAEGVETVAEMRVLSSMGCHEVQGYWLAKPMAEREVFSWVRMRDALRANAREAGPHPSSS